MLLLMCPLIGYSFFQAVSLYGEASAAGLQSPVLASSLSPLDGVLVPTLGASYVAVTLLFPFVAIRVLGQEKESGALRLLVQLPYPSPTLIAAKLAAVLAAWVLSSVPAFSALAMWEMLGGHLSAPETLNLLFGHLLYGLLVGAIALFAASVSESAATAAIVTLAFTIGSWVLDFTMAGHPGFLEWIAGLSLTQVLRTFEQGLLSVGLVVGIGAAVCGFAALATVWLPPGVHVRNKLVRSIVCAFAAAIVLGLALNNIRPSVRLMLVLEVVSMVAVALFSGVLTGIIYAVAGIKHAAVWGAVTGLFAMIPYLGYVVVAGVACSLAAGGSVTSGLAVFVLGCTVHFVGDKIVRPVLVGSAVKLGFVWVLMGSLGGLELMGLLGVLLGPVVLALGSSLWRQWVHDRTRSSTGGADLP